MKEPIISTTYGSAQHIGDRSHQCDATAVRTAPDGTRAFVLLDGIGSSDTVRTWTRTAARRLAQACALHGHAEAGLRAEYTRYAAEPIRQDDARRSEPPSAAAVAAVHSPAGLLSIAWAGDTRAYLLLDGVLSELTEDHNLRRVDGGSRDMITTCLGSAWDDRRTQERWGHPAIESMAAPLTRPGRLLLASDGAYEPYEDTGGLLADHLAGALESVPHSLTEGAVALARAQPAAADNATVLVIEL
ncbi:mucin-2 [Streptomyces sp. 35G-GA-8]|uniref:mucin-2 n=1 Tax=Streptomyces sp. 35G-GA-8 TaxID=2939434 RepID=UPI00201EE0B3|nr:mucin-2 [Streptomyces sp. 35G-GA-8]MCL7382166.1 mucin-2 [Streptomyces sp. 35G-GA-8]